MTFTVNPASDRPLYRQLEDSIRQAIRSGRLEAGDRLPAIRAICDDTGLAYATMSKVTRQLVEEGLLIAKSGAGTRVADKLSASMQTSTGSIGIASVSTLGFMYEHSPYFTAALLAIQDEGVNRGYVVSYDRWSAERSPLELFQDMNCVDGIIVFNSFGVTDQDVCQLRAKTDRLVCLGGAVTVDGVATVHSDNVRASRESVQKLIEMGHRDIGFCADHQASRSAEERHEGYRQALEAAGIPLKPEFTFRADGDSLARLFLGLPVRPTALLVANGITQFTQNLPLLYQNGVRVGSDLYLAAWDEAHFGCLQSLGIPYLRITQNVDALGHLAVKTLCDLIDGQSWSQEDLLLPANIETIGHVPSVATV